MPNNENPTEGQPQVGSDALLALERAYDAFKACEKRAIWGGSCEVEMAAQQDMRAHGQTMFAALEAFMVEHKANDEMTSPHNKGDNHE